MRKLSEYNTEHLGENLRILRKTRRITQDELARKLNTSRSCISNYELGNRQPDSETIRRIADIFDVSIDYLLGRSTIKMSIRNEANLKEIEEINSRAGHITKLDLNGVSTRIKCMVLDFYAYKLRQRK